MSKYDKSVITPLIAVLALVIGSIFHISISDDLQQQVIETLGMIGGVVTTVRGILKNHKKEPTE